MMLAVPSMADTAPRLFPMAGLALQQAEVVLCPRTMIGRVIGKNGDTIKALQAFTGAMIQIDQSTDPTKVTVAGEAHSLQTAVDMVKDIVAGNFKGFALLRQLAMAAPDSQSGGPSSSPPKPMYIRGYGIVPPTQQTNDLDSAESRSANAALGLALAENYRSSSLGTDGMHHSLSLGADGVRSLSLSSTGTAHYLGLNAMDSLQPGTPSAAQSSLHSFAGPPAQQPLGQLDMHALLARLMSSAGSPSLSPTASCMAYEPSVLADAGSGLHPLHTTPRSAAATPLGTPLADSPVGALGGAERGSTLGAYGSPLPGSPLLYSGGQCLQVGTPQLYSLGSANGGGRSGCGGDAGSLFSTGGPAVGQGLPGNWARLKDPEGRSFYYNSLTRESTWELPCRS